MEQIGKVITQKGNMAEVLVNRVSACGENCAHCKGGCTPTKVTSWVENPIDAKTGDMVKIETDTKDVVKASFVLYFIPVLFAMFGAILAESVLQNSYISVVFAVVFFFLAFGIIKRFERKIVPVSKIVKIINS